MLQFVFIGLHVKYRYFCNVLMRRDISQRVHKTFPTPNLMKICQLVPELFYADGQTDTKNLVVAYRNFAKKPKT